MKSLGKATMDQKEMTAGAYGVFTLVYETGEYGIDDSGEILIARRDVCDSAIPQFNDPQGEGYMRVSTHADVKLKVSYVPDKFIRPWRSCICIKVTDGSLKPGDKVQIAYGTQDGKGFRMQTFREDEHIFRVLVDCAGSGNFYEVENSPVMKITGGNLNQVEAVAPSLVEKNKPFDVFVRALDGWGNVDENCEDVIEIGVCGQWFEVQLSHGLGKVQGITLGETGRFECTIRDKKGQRLGTSNPIQCTESVEKNLYWGDMHGQTKETVGTGTLAQYFSFARDCAFLDFSAWQGNDFQVTDETWQNVCKHVKQFHAPHRFVTFLGYEWSGTTPVGGDYNIYYLKDDLPIFRSYHWQIGQDGDGSDRTPLSALWQEFAGRDDVMGIPHVGGRHGNLDFCNENFVHLLEIHSHHGTFEWFFEDALKKGLKLGVIAASDDHTCRPGLSYPTKVTSRGFVSFDVMGGYTAVYADALTRESLWEALKNRHCYGTTGQRIVLEVKCGNHVMGDAFEVQGSPKIDIHAVGQDVIAEVEIKRGLETVYAYSRTLPVKKDTVKIQWSGVRVKSRGKKVTWDGRLKVINGAILSVQPFAFNQEDEGITQISNDVVEWKSCTSGDIDGVEVTLDLQKDTQLMFESGPISFSVRVDELQKGKISKDAGGVNQMVEISLAPSAKEKEVHIVFEDTDIKRGGVNPYWVKVVQENGHMAWCSPMYITRKE